MTEQQKLPIVVLVSGSGSNLQAIIDAAAQDLPVEIRAVISNRADAYGLERAKRAAIPARLLDHTDYPDRESYDRALMALIDDYSPALVVLAGFMRILTPGFVNHYKERLLNIHPSLLPKYRGLHTHQRALEAGDPVHGASVHLVTEELDGGPVILQVRVPVEPDDDESTLAARVLTQEHLIYPLAIRWIAEGRLRVNDGTLELDGQALQGPVIMEFNQVTNG
ncbi:phosphoribosylglycinamide formyltransferase [Sedimenticola thiotaurini]|uniref:Phosphoribosylglycinamide formyltransferase n=1 Tax=Sedimenticola thiotaurini TaxID=1543721 RepID=A0A0F7JUQ6_9GAMM|nr:phosphoribosylglycinamide formyltransferase [Sedimenticola thiotaurini]AKH20311.1 phosphoribosylglycinamide formyltransferase [Sedimenticola thiotaurini]